MTICIQMQRVCTVNVCQHLTKCCICSAVWSLITGVVQIGCLEGDETSTKPAPCFVISHGRRKDWAWMSVCMRMWVCVSVWERYSIYIVWFNQVLQYSVYHNHQPTSCLESWYQFYVNTAQQIAISDTTRKLHLLAVSLSLTHQWFRQLQF